MLIPEKQRINLKIGVYNISLNIDAAQEPVYRDAASLINKTYDKYNTHFPNAPVEQIWVYVALAIAVNLRSDVRDKDLTPLLSAVRDINSKIEDTLNSK